MRKMSKRRQKTLPDKQKVIWTPYLLIMPAVILILGVMLYPLCKTHFIWHFRIIRQCYLQMVSLGLITSRRFFTTSEFYSALFVSLKWVVALVLLQLIFGMIVALILNQNFKGRGFFRALVFVPWAMSGVLTAVFLV